MGHVKDDVCVYLTSLLMGVNYQVLAIPYSLMSQNESSSYYLSIGPKDLVNSDWVYVAVQYEYDLFVPLVYYFSCS